MLKRGEADIIGVSNDNAVSLRDNGGYQLRQTKASTIPGLFLTGYWLQPVNLRCARARGDGPGDQPPGGRGLVLQGLRAASWPATSA